MPDDSQGVVSGGQQVAGALKAEGVDVVYAVRGAHVTGMYESCAEAGIDIVEVRHERVAVHAADGHARVTGKPGCAVVTAGPGTTDAITGVATALRAESPMLLIGGRGEHGPYGTASFRDLPQLDMMTPVTKYAAAVPGPAGAARMVSTAFRACRQGAPGPSFLEIPRDVLDAKVPVEEARFAEAGHHRAEACPAGDPEAVEKLADLLVRADRPAILLGSQVGTACGADAAVEFVRALNVPAYMNGTARGTLAPGDPHHFQLSRRYAFANADLILVVGTPFDFRVGIGKRTSPAAVVARIDLDHRAVDEDPGIALGIVGDAGPVLSSLTQAAGGRLDNGSVRRRAWLDELRTAERTALDMRLPQLTSDTAPVHPYRLVSEIDEFLTEDSLFIGDGGDIVTLAGQTVRPKSRGHWLDAGPLGTPGTGIPFALAAKRARPGEEIVTLFGEGAFSPTGWDFETLVRHNLPFIGIVGNNSPAHPIRYGRAATHGRERERTADTLGDVPYDKFAQLLGGYGEEVREPADIAPALRRARESGRPSLINVWVDPDAYAPGTMNQTLYK
ncbi:thiamine pyrophosphate-binding protein [Streptomyces sp. NPDC059396]|uniref:thiamine pyrophosphate-binding protein n=1 Tax=Streptomyces sp. NPDC059396 TaxID=3346819 RepID=UPI0036B87A4E